MYTLSKCHAVGTAILSTIAQLSLPQAHRGFAARFSALELLINRQATQAISTSEKLNDDYMTGKLNILRLSHKVVTLPLWLTM